MRSESIYMDGRLMPEWMDGWVDGWLDEWINGKGLIQYVGMLKSKMYVNKVGLDNSKKQTTSIHLYVYI